MEKNDYNCIFFGVLVLGLSLLAIGWLFHNWDLPEGKAVLILGAITMFVALVALAAKNFPVRNKRKLQ